VHAVGLAVRRGTAPRASSAARRVLVENQWGNATQCTCYSPLLDPTPSCAPLVDDFVASIFNEQVSNVTCACHADFTFGFFASSTPKRHVRRPDPPNCDICQNPSFGPPPGLVVDVG